MELFEAVLPAPLRYRAARAHQRAGARRALRTDSPARPIRDQDGSRTPSRALNKLQFESIMRREDALRSEPSAHLRTCFRLPGLTQEALSLRSGWSLGTTRIELLRYLARCCAPPSRANFPCLMRYLRYALVARVRNAAWQAGPCLLTSKPAPRSKGAEFRRGLP